MTDTPTELFAARGALMRQIPSFLIIGSLGFCIDSAITIALVQGLGAAPQWARLPAFAFATVINFFLNRAFTFGASEGSWVAALGRYALVCLGGLVVNYAVYAGCLALAASTGFATSSPVVLTFCIAAGTATATIVTFSGFRAYAFRR